MQKAQAGPLRVGRNEINKEEEGFPVGPQEEQWFRVRNEHRCVHQSQKRQTEDRC